MRSRPAGCSGIGGRRRRSLHQDAHLQAIGLQVHRTRPWQRCAPGGAGKRPANPRLALPAACEWPLAALRNLAPPGTRLQGPANHPPRTLSGLASDKSLKSPSCARRRPVSACHAAPVAGQPSVVRMISWRHGRATRERNLRIHRPGCGSVSSRCPAAPARRCQPESSGCPCGCALFFPCVPTPPNARICCPSLLHGLLISLSFPPPRFSFPVFCFLLFLSPARVVVAASTPSHPIGGNE